MSEDHEGRKTRLVVGLYARRYSVSWMGLLYAGG